MESKLLKIIAAVSLFVIISGSVSFWKENRYESPAVAPETTTEPANLDASEENDRAEGERVMRSFLAAYNSFRYGDVSNIVALYPSMCTELQAAEETRANNLRQQFKNFQEYVTVEGHIKESEVESYDENKNVVRIVIEKITWNGAILPDDNKAGTYKLVNREGQTYKGDKYDLKEKITKETYKVTGIKEMSEWKECEYKKID